MLNLLPNSTYGLVAAVAKAPVYSKPKFCCSWVRIPAADTKIHVIFFYTDFSLFSHFRLRSGLKHMPLEVKIPLKNEYFC